MGLRQLMSKRALGWLSWRRKRQYHHSQRTLEATTEAVMALTPDAIVLTGDLLHIGLREEMRQIRPWLQRLSEQVPVMLVPGNHDLYAPDSLAHWQQELGDLNVFGDNSKQNIAGNIWPRLLKVNQVKIVGLSSAYPAPLTRADGQLGATQRARLARWLKEHSIDDAALLLALHHPATHHLAKPRKNLLDAQELQDLLQQNPRKVTALVHGHLHQNLSYQVANTPCYCTASASSNQVTAPASFRLLEFNDNHFTSRLYVGDFGDSNTDPVFNERPDSQNPA